MKKLKVGFVGLGLMGSPMAQNILKKKFPLYIYNRTLSKTIPLKKLGAVVCKSPAEVASNVDVLITMVTGPKDVERVLLGKNGVVEALRFTQGKVRKNLIVIDMSTIGPKAAKEIAANLRLQGIEFIDAPVTGSTTWAKSGELVIFAGGEKRVLNKVKSVLEAMGKKIHHMGPVGSGQAMKLVNNLLVGTTLTSLAEAFLLGVEMKLDRKQIQEVLEGVPIVSQSMKLKMPNLVSNKFPTAFSVKNISKDLELALGETEQSSRASHTKKDFPTLKVAAKLYRKAIQMGLGDEDNSSVIKVLDT